MNISLHLATPEDACVLAITKKTVWEQTYRGIYPDEMLDNFDLEFYTQLERQRMESPEHRYYLYTDGDRCAGYFSFGPYNFGEYKDFDLCLNNLYICNGYKGIGLGKQAFAVVEEHCRNVGISKFFCGCNIHNLPARAFYLHMGGKVGIISGGHENLADDIMHFEFYIGE